MQKLVMTVFLFFFLSQIEISMIWQKGFNTLPNKQKMSRTKLNAFADDKLNVASMRISLFDRVENTLRKGEKNAVYQHVFVFPVFFLLQGRLAEPHSSFSSVTDLRTGGRWFDPWLGQYSFRGLMIVIATGFIPLSPLSVVSTMVKWESSH